MTWKKDNTVVAFEIKEIKHYCVDCHKKKDIANQLIREGKGYGVITRDTLDGSSQKLFCDECGEEIK